MLQATKISKSYATAAGDLPILRDVTLQLNRGDALSIMGPSGSGKSTLLYIIGVLEPPSSGKITLDSEDPFSMDESRQAAFRNKNIGFLFQDHCLLPQLSVLENVLTPVLATGKPANEDRERAKKLLDQVGLSSRLHHKPAELSGGEKQRTAMARALIRAPKLLLCDEPTGNLDRASAETVADMLLALHGEQKTILIVVTHSAELADRFPQRMEMRDASLRSR